MRPLRLHIDGFTSFRNPQEIDFSELDLFVIIGPTGSGKSSILDAVTLALFGTVPRTNKHELKELISLGASQAKVQLDFEVDGSHYRVARRLPRNGAQSATIERIDGHDTIPEVDGSGVKEANARIEQIVGLDYEAFTRAVLLPQGAFAEFLKGDTSQRRAILVRLLDLDRFVRAGQLANQRAKELSAQVTATADLLEREYGEVDEDALRALVQQSGMAEERAAVADRARARGTEVWERRQEIVRRRQRAEAIAAKLSDQASELSDLEERSRLLSRRDAETREGLEVARAGRREAEEGEATARAAWTDCRAEVGDEGVLAGLAASAEALVESEARLERGTEQLEASRAEQEALAGRKAARAAEMEAAKAREAEVRATVADATHAVESARQARDRAKAGAKLVEELEGERTRRDVLEEKLEAAEKAEKSAVARLEETAAALRSLETEHRAAALRTHLHEGDDCPVCGATVAALPEPDPKVETKLVKARADAQTAAVDQRKAARIPPELRGSIEGVRRSVARLEGEIEAFGDLPSVPESESALATAEATANEARSHLDEAAEVHTAAAKLLAEVEQDIARVETRIEEEEKRLRETRMDAATERKRLVEVLGAHSAAEYRTMISERQERLQKAAEARDAATKMAETARKTFDAASVARAELDQEAKGLDGSIEHHRSRLGERQEQLHALMTDEVADGPEVDGEDRASRIEALQGLADRLMEVASRLREELTRGVREADELLEATLRETGLAAEASSAMDLLNAGAQAARLEAERAKDAIKSLRSRLERKREMAASINEKRARMLRFEKVGRDLRRDRFIDFLLEESFQDLALRASNELRLISDGRYSLASSGDSFAVVDHANADEQRSVVTLSGGETFLASLALALALSQGITDIAGHSAAARLESMFIDEGFGTLDPTALDLAVEALERLRAGERMVGVITHVPALAERIPNGIEVNREGGGSVVTLR